MFVYIALNVRPLNVIFPFFGFFFHRIHSFGPWAQNKSFRPCTDTVYAKTRVTFLVVDLEIWHRIKYCHCSTLIYYLTPNTNSPCTIYI